MPRNLPAEPKLYRCLFCGETFHASEVLFADEIKKASQAYPDPVLVQQYEKFISAPDIIPTQLLHRWDGLPLQNLDFSSGEEMPFSIHACCYDGQLKLDKPDAVQAQADAGAALLENLAGDGEQGNTAGQLQKIQKELLRGVPEGTYKEINKRICPYCHCTVPVGLEQLRTYRVSMLGGTSSGKTTYMVLAARQMTTLYPGGNVLNNALNLANGELIGESDAYFRKIHDLYIHHKLQGTPIAEYIPKRVFPLVFRMTPRNGSEPFFLTLQDYPGEGMVRSDHFINSPNTLAADGVILLVDPEQLMNCTSMIQKQPEYEGVPAQQPEARDGSLAQITASAPDNIVTTLAGQTASEKTDTQPEEELHCIDDLPQTARVMCENINRFFHLQKIVVTLSKLDCLYPRMQKDFSILQRGQYPLLENGDLRQDHRDYINLSVLDNLNMIMKQVLSTFERSLGNPERDYTNLKDMLGCEGEKKPLVTLKAVSSYTWDDARMEYVQFVCNQPVPGHRLLEPLLELLADARLLPSWDPNAPEPRTRFGRRAGSSKQRN